MPTRYSPPRTPQGRRKTGVRAQSRAGGFPGRRPPVVRPLEPTIPSLGGANGLVFHHARFGKRGLGPVAS